MIQWSYENFYVSFGIPRGMNEKDMVEQINIKCVLCIDAKNQVHYTFDFRNKILSDFVSIKFKLVIFVDL